MIYQAHGEVVGVGSYERGGGNGGEVRQFCVINCTFL